MGISVGVKNSNLYFAITPHCLIEKTTGAIYLSTYAGVDSRYTKIHTYENVTIIAKISANITTNQINILRGIQLHPDIFKLLISLQPQ